MNDTNAASERTAERPGAGRRELFRSPKSVLQPASVALVGASERAKWAAQIIGNLREFGYAGRVFLVNPRQQEVLGEKCYPSLRELPEAVEHAIVIVPAAPAAPAKRKPAPACPAAMGDGDDPQSRQRGAWLADFLPRSALRLAGPNCMG